MYFSISRPVVRIVISLLLFSALLSTAAIAKEVNPVLLDRLEASVNTALVLLSDVSRFRKTLALRHQLDPLFASTSLATKGAVATDREIVEYLVDEKLISEQFPIKDPEVEQEIVTIQTNNHIDRKALRAALQEQGFTFEEYFQLIKASLSKRNLIDRDIRTKVFITDDDVRNYFYNTVRDVHQAAQAFRIRILTVTPANYKTKAAAIEVAQKARRALESGEPFEDVAKQYSDDPTANTGGDLGMMQESELSPLIRQEVKKLKLGEISPILGSDKSKYFILKLVDVKSGEEDRFAQMKEEIRNQLTAAEYQHQISLWLQRQRQGNTSIRFAGETNLPVQYGG